jgi:uncharacterized protein
MGLRLEETRMKCPKCEVVPLTMADRSGVEIDYCPACRGVWLDRGELDKIIERAAIPNDYSQRTAERPFAPTEYERKRVKFDDDDDDDRDGGRGYRKKRGGFLGELFDF